MTTSTFPHPTMCLPGALAFESCLAPRSSEEPRNIARMRLALGDLVFRLERQSHYLQLVPETEVLAKHRDRQGHVVSLIQHRPANVAAMVCLCALSATAANSSDAESESRVSLSQGSSQKSVEVLLPTSQRIEAAKKAQVSASSCNGNDAQARPGSTLCSQSQRRCSALPMRFRSRMPRPPRQVG
jgi:hypothetical protein